MPEPHQPADPLVPASAGSWEVRGHAAVVHAATTPEVYASGGRRHLHIPNGLDGHEHQRFRAVVDRHLGDEKILPLAPMIREVTETAAAGLVGAGAAAEIVHDYGRLVAVRVQCRWLGWPDGLEGELLDWIADNFAAARSGDPARNADVAARFDRIVSGILAGRRALADAGSPLPEDPTTGLMRDRVEDPAAPGGQRPLTEPELVSLLRNWTSGDLGSIAASIGVVVHHVAADQRLQQRLRELAISEDDHTDELDAAVDEMLRIDDPFPANRRVLTCPAELGGHSLPAGTVVSLAWAAANRDPQVFGDPDEFRPHENRPANLVYGTGPHVCPGRLLSTLQIRGALTALLRATSRIALDPARPPARYPVPARGFDSVPVLIE